MRAIVEFVCGTVGLTVRGQVCRRATFDRCKVRGGWFFVWSFVVLFLSCRVLCGVVLVVCLCV